MDIYKEKRLLILLTSRLRFHKKKIVLVSITSDALNLP